MSLFTSLDKRLYDEAQSKSYLQLVHAWSFGRTSERSANQISTKVWFSLLHYVPNASRQTRIVQQSTSIGVEEVHEQPLALTVGG